MLLLALACTAGPPAETAIVPADTEIADSAGTDLLPDERLNVLLIVVDTLPAKRLSLYGHTNQTTPNLAAWAADRVIFDAYTNLSFSTPPSMASIMSGTHPSVHRCCFLELGDVENQYDQPTDLPDAAETLAEAFQAAGYETAALYKTEIYDVVGAMDQGFSTFRKVVGDWNHGESAGQLTDEALSWLETRGSPAPFFLYLHYMEPHTEYIAPAPWRGSYSTGIDSALTGLESELQAFVQGAAEPTEADVRMAEALYDEEVAYLDEQLGRLLDALAADGRMDDTIVVLLADHGEQFNEHGGWLHYDLWQEIIRPPLIVHAPGAVPRRVYDRVRSLDVAPTLAALAGLAPGGTWQGRDLSPLLNGQPIEPETLLARQNKHAALIRTDGLKYLEKGGEVVGLFDLNVDPGETTDLSAERPDDVAAMSAEIAALDAEYEALSAELFGE